MRALFVLLGIAVLVVVALLQFRIISFDQTRAGMVQAPAFKANVAHVTVGTENKTVAVPTINIEKPANTQAPAQ